MEPWLIGVTITMLPGAAMPVTPQEMRAFAADCFRWSYETANASQRELIRQIARTWMHTASALERRVGNEDDVLPDLRPKLD